MLLHQHYLMSMTVVDLENFTVLTKGLETNCGGLVDKYIGDAVIAMWFHGEE